ncbi:hypothetical protein [Gemmata massiliana]|nr:hypothetical protein [Gemmata massiliana]
MVNDAAADALMGADGIYQRGGQLVRVVRLDEPPRPGPRSGFRRTRP